MYLGADLSLIVMSEKFQLLLGVVQGSLQNWMGVTSNAPPDSFFLNTVQYIFLNLSDVCFHQGLTAPSLVKN